MIKSKEYVNNKFKNCTISNEVNSSKNHSNCNSNINKNVIFNNKYLHSRIQSTNSNTIIVSNKESKNIKKFNVLYSFNNMYSNSLCISLNDNENLIKSNKFNTIDFSPQFNIIQKYKKTNKNSNAYNLNKILTLKNLEFKKSNKYFSINNFKKNINNVHNKFSSTNNKEYYSLKTINIKNDYKKPIMNNNTSFLNSNRTNYSNYYSCNYLNDSNNCAINNLNKNKICNNVYINYKDTNISNNNVNCKRFNYQQAIENQLKNKNNIKTNKNYKNILNLTNNLKFKSCINKQAQSNLKEDKDCSNKNIKMILKNKNYNHKSLKYKIIDLFENVKFKLFKVAITLFNNNFENKNNIISLLNDEYFKILTSLKNKLLLNNNSIDIYDIKKFAILEGYKNTILPIINNNTLFQNFIINNKKKAQDFNIQNEHKYNCASNNNNNKKLLDKDIYNLLDLDINNIHKNIIGKENININKYDLNCFNSLVKFNHLNNYLNKLNNNNYNNSNSSNSNSNSNNLNTDIHKNFSTKFLDLISEHKNTETNSNAINTSNLDIVTYNITNKNNKYTNNNSCKIKNFKSNSTMLTLHNNINTKFNEVNKSYLFKNNDLKKANKINYTNRRKSNNSHVINIVKNINSNVKNNTSNNRRNKSVEYVNKIKLSLINKKDSIIKEVKSLNVKKNCVTNTSKLKLKSTIGINNKKLLRRSTFINKNIKFKTKSLNISKDLNKINNYNTTNRLNFKKLTPLQAKSLSKININLNVLETKQNVENNNTIVKSSNFVYKYNLSKNKKKSFEDYYINKYYEEDLLDKKLTNNIKINDNNCNIFNSFKQLQFNKNELLDSYKNNTDDLFDTKKCILDNEISNITDKNINNMKINKRISNIFINILNNKSFENSNSNLNYNKNSINDFNKRYIATTSNLFIDSNKKIKKNNSFSSGIIKKQIEKPLGINYQRYSVFNNKYSFGKLINNYSINNNIELSKQASNKFNSLSSKIKRNSIIINKNMLLNTTNESNELEILNNPTFFNLIKLLHCKCNYFNVKSYNVNTISTSRYNDKNYNNSRKVKFSIIQDSNIVLNNDFGNIKKSRSFLVNNNINYKDNTDRSIIKNKKYIKDNYNNNNKALLLKKIIKVQNIIDKYTKSNFSPIFNSNIEDENLSELFTNCRNFNYNFNKYDNDFERDLIYIKSKENLINNEKRIDEKRKESNFSLNLIFDKIDNYNIEDYINKIKTSIITNEDKFSKVKSIQEKQINNFINNLNDTRKMWKNSKTNTGKYSISCRRESTYLK